MNTQILYDELQLPAYAGKDDTQVLDALNAKSILVWRELPNADVYNYLQTHLLTLKLRGVTLADAATPYGKMVDTPLPGITPPTTLRAVAFNAMDLFKSQVAYINGQNATTQGLIMAMQGAGVFSASEVAAFWEQFKVHLSRAEQLLSEGVTLTAQDIAAARLYPKYLHGVALAQAREDAEMARARTFRQSQVRLSDALGAMERGEDRDLGEWESAE